MDVSLIIADTVDLLSRITGLELKAEDLTFPVVLIAASVCFVKAVLHILEGKKATTAVNQLIQSCFKGLHQGESILDEKIKRSEAAKLKIFEQMGEASGREFKIKFFATQELEYALGKTTQSWNKWVKKLDVRIFEDSTKWDVISSLSQEELIQDYKIRFKDSLLKEIGEWEKDLKKNILLEQIQDLNRMIENEIEEIRNNLKILNTQVDTTIFHQFISNLRGDIKLDSLGINPTINYQDNQDNWVQSLMSGLGGGLTVSVLAGLTGLGVIPVLIAGSVAGTTGSLLSHFSGLTKNQVKQKVCEAGLKEFHESQEEIFDKICANIQSMYDSRVELASDSIKQAMLLCENLIEQQNKVEQ